MIELRELIIRGILHQGETNKETKKDDPCDCREEDEIRQRLEELQKMLDEKNER